MRISILGCGWLGLPLALRLKELGHSLRGSVTSEQRAGELHSLGLDIHVINLHTSRSESLHGFLEGTELLIICVPPAKESAETSMVKALDEFLKIAEHLKIQRIIFTSSIGVYPNTEDLGICHEEDVAEDPAGKQEYLLRLESLVLDCQSESSVIFRLGGLIGGDRHPVNYLAGRKKLPNGEGPVNLIHREDCIDAILTAINQAPPREVYNLVYPDYPTRKNYYLKKARQLQLPEPHFLREPSVGKVVSSEAFVRDTDFVFKAGI